MPLGYDKRQDNGMGGADMERILLVEDDSAIYQPLTSFLRGEGFAVRQASGQREALALLETEEFDLVLLDVGLRDGNGFSVCSAVKQRGGTAVIFLSASGDEYSVVTGLDLGADDYIAKPFSIREVVARVKAVLRRAGEKSGGQQILKFHGLEVNLDKKTVSIDGEDIPFSKTEFELLALLLRERGHVFSRQELINRIWPKDVLVLDRTVDVNITRMRKKIKDYAHHIVTRLGYGYFFEE